jgi:O-antigen ligase
MRTIPASSAAPKAASLALAALTAALVLAFDPLCVDAYQMPKAILLRLGALALLALASRPGALASPARPRPEDAPLAAWLGVCALFTAWTLHAHTSFFGRYQMYIWGFWTLASLAALHWTASRLDPRRTPERLFTAACLAGAAALALGYLLRVDARPASTLGTSINYSALLAMLIPIWLAAVRRARCATGRAAALLALGACVHQLLNTLCRGAWLGALAGAGLWAVLGGGRGRRLALGGGLAAAVAALTLLTSSPARERARVLLDPSESSASSRLGLWRMALRMSADAKGLGRGLDSFGLLSPRYETPEFRRRSGGLSIATYAHNEILQIASTLGLPGLAAYAWLWWSWLSAALRRIRSEEDERLREALRALLASACALWVHAEFNFPSVATLAMQWTFLGALGGAPPRGESRGRGALGALACLLLLAGSWVCARQWLADREALRARALIARKDFATAVPAAERALRLNPYGQGYAMALTHALRGRALRGGPLERARDFRLAIEASRAETLRRPFDADARHNLAMALMWSVLDGSKGLLGEAVENELRAVELAPSISAFRNSLGEIYHYGGDVERAKKAWVEAAEADPSNRKANSWLERYVETDVFLAAPQDLKVSGLRPGVDTDLRGAGKGLLKLANLRDREIELRVEPLRGYQSVSECPPDYPEAAGGSSIAPEAASLRLPANGVRPLSLRVRAPEGRGCFLVRVRCTSFGIPVDRTVRVLTESEAK